MDELSRWILEVVAKHYVLTPILASVVSAVAAMIGTMIFGRGYKKRIADLERKLDEARGSVSLTITGNTYNEYRSEGGDYHLNFDGKGDVVSRSPIEVISKPALIESAWQLSIEHIRARDIRKEEEE